MEQGKWNSIDAELITESQKVGIIDETRNFVFIENEKNRLVLR